MIIKLIKFINIVILIIRNDFNDINYYYHFSKLLSKLNAFIFIIFNFHTIKFFFEKPVFRKIIIFKSYINYHFLDDSLN
jgi:hypothetical protein